MKNFYPAILTVALFCLLLSCNSSLETIRYSNDDSFKNEGVVYYLPKNLINLKVTYTLKVPYRLINGREFPVPEDKISPILEIKGPILLSSKLVADTNNRFLLTGSRISKNFFTKSSLDFNLSQNGLLSSIDADVEDQSTEFGEKVILASAKVAKTFLPPLNIDGSAVPQPETKYDILNDYVNSKNKKGRIEAQDLIGLMTNLDAINELDFDSELSLYIELLTIEYLSAADEKESKQISTKIQKLQDLIEWHQNRNKVFYKTIEKDFEIDIDPFHVYNLIGLTSRRTADSKYIHEIHPTYLFSEVDSMDFPVVQLTLTNNKFNKSYYSKARDSEENKKIEGVLVRHPASTIIQLDIDGSLYGTKEVYLAQLGSVSNVPVRAKRAGKNEVTLTFDTTTGSLARYKQETSSGSEKVGEFLENSSQTLQETVDYLKYEKRIKELEALKSEETLENEIFSLTNNELARELEQLKTEEAILKLEQSLEELSQGATESTEFDQTIEELTQQQKILELQLLIEQLKNQLSNVGN